MATRKPDRREQILRVASEVFATKGYHAAKMDDIAAASEVAKGTLYLYFEDKRAIFTELIDGLALRIAGAILPVDTDADVVEQVKHNIRAVLGVLVQQPHVTSLLFDHASGIDEEFRRKMDSFYQGLKAQLAASLSEGQELGIVKGGNVQLYASLTVGALREVLAEARQKWGGSHTREEVVEAIFEVLQGGYLRLQSDAKGPKRRVYADLGPPASVATKRAAKR